MKVIDPDHATNRHLENRASAALRTRVDRPVGAGQLLPGTKSLCGSQHAPIIPSRNRQAAFYERRELNKTGRRRTAVWSPPNWGQGDQGADLGRSDQM